MANTITSDTQKTAAKTKETSKKAERPLDMAEVKKEIVDKLWEVMPPSFASFFKHEYAKIDYRMFCKLRAEDVEFDALVDEYRKALADTMFDAIVEIADDELLDVTDEFAKIAVPADMERRKMRIDARKYIISKINPSRYGNKVEITGAFIPDGVFDALADIGAKAEETESELAAIIAKRKAKRQGKYNTAVAANDEYASHE